MYGSTRQRRAAARLAQFFMEVVQNICTSRRDGVVQLHEDYNFHVCAGAGHMYGTTRQRCAAARRPLAQRCAAAVRLLTCRGVTRRILLQHDLRVESAFGYNFLYA